MSKPQEQKFNDLIQFSPTLFDSLHAIVDLNSSAMWKTTYIAKQRGIELPDLEEFSSEAAGELHDKLFQLESDITGVDWIAPKRRS